MAKIIDSLIVTLGIDASAFEEGSEKARKTQADLTNETEKGTKKMSSGFAAVRREVLLLASAFFALKSVASFFGSTITSAANLGYLSENLRISTERINAMQRASERMGGSSEGMTAQLKEAADTLAQLRSGLGPNESLQWFFRLGGSSADLKDGNSLMMARSKIIHDIFQTDPSKAALMAKQLGILDDQFDLWKQGPEAVQALTDAQEKNSAVTAQNAKEAQELLRRWLDFTDALKGTFMKAILALAPAITIILDKFVEWANQLGSNKDSIQALGKSLTDFLINTDWSGIIRDAKDFAASVKDIAGSIKEVIDRWDEWRGKPKVQTPGVTNLPGRVRFGKTEDIEADDRAKGIKTPAKKELQGWQKDYVEGLDKGIDNTVKTFKPLADSDHPVIDAFTGGWLNKLLRELAEPHRPGDPIKPKALGVESQENNKSNTSGNDYSFSSAFLKALKEITNPKRSNQENIRNGSSRNVPFEYVMDQSKYAVSKLVKMGWTQAQAAGMVGSLMQESQMDPKAVNPDSGAYGLAQWLEKSRIANFEKWAGEPLKGSSFDKQLEFMNYELTKGSYSKAGDAIKASKTPEQAAVIHRKMYEQPGESESNDAKRKLYARQIEQSVQQSNASVSANVASGASTSVANKIDNSKTSSSSNSTTVNGGIKIYTQATDADAIAKEIKPGIERYNPAMQANSGIR